MVSYNTANDNRFFGIFASQGSLVTHNTAMNNNRETPGFEFKDFAAACPSTVTFNTSTKGFPASYSLVGNGCQTVGNE